MGPDTSDGIASTAAPPSESHATFSIVAPAEQHVPVVFASPHSGRVYGSQFIESARIDLLKLRRSEDAFIDELFASAPLFGAPLIKAHFPRAYVDPNREPYELDPAMFDAPLPHYVNATSPRVAAGLGTVARVVASGDEIYKNKLSFSEVLHRIERHYHPYHNALTQLLETTIRKFSCYLLIDCHSMPSIGGPMDSDPGDRRVDFILGDCHGRTCTPTLVDRVERSLKAMGYVVRRNIPYAGGFTTRAYGRPHEGRHALQIEINRALYMDELRIEKGPQYDRVLSTISKLIETITQVDCSNLTAG